MNYDNKSLESAVLPPKAALMELVGPGQLHIAHTTSAPAWCEIRPESQPNS